jgi:ABC-2 type transport system ATP-binding protein
MEEIIKVLNLTKSYNERIVLNDISFSVHKGESLGILGSNGAGKTTLLETIEGLRVVEKGLVEVLGKDITKDYKTVQNMIGVQLQKSSLFGDLTVKQNIRLYANLYKNKTNVDALLDEFNLKKQKNNYVNNLSGGQFQRLNLCIAMINNPAILFLDEPTTGLDPNARLLLWNKILALKEKGTSIILTTHYMEEAQSLCDRVIIIHKGKFVANDSPENLIRGLNAPKFIVLKFNGKIPDNCFDNYDIHSIKDALYLKSDKPEKELVDIIKIIEQKQISIQNISIHESTLEDVYMSITKENYN